MTDIPLAQILLTHSYFLRFDPKGYRAMTPYPPLGTLYAASTLARAGFSVVVHDVMFAKEEREIARILAQHRPDLVVIYDDQFNYLTKMCLSRMREAAIAMTTIAKERGCPIVIFSSDATDHLSEYFDHGADYVILGEAEETLKELANHLLRSAAPYPEAIRGLVFKRGSEIVRTPPRNAMEDLDVHPFPAWSLINLESYRKAWRRRQGFFSLNIVTTRGCPFHCNWCAKPIYGQVYHSRSPENVVEEMLELRSLANPDHLWMADDIFGLRSGWLARFAEVVRQRNALIPFKCLSRVDLLLRDDNIRHLTAAGCQEIWVGAESGSQKILDAMEKGTTVEQIYQATSLLHANGIRVGFFLQFGYPGETLADIHKTFRMIRECSPDDIGVSVSYPLPGTKFYDRVQSELSSKRNWIDSGDLDMMFRGTYSRDFYRKLHTFAHKKFRVWRGHAILAKALKNPRTFDFEAMETLARSACHALTLPFSRPSGLPFFVQ